MKKLELKKLIRRHIEFWIDSNIWKCCDFMDYPLLLIDCYRHGRDIRAGFLHNSLILKLQIRKFALIIELKYNWYNKYTYACNFCEEKCENRQCDRMPKKYFE